MIYRQYAGNTAVAGKRSPPDRWAAPAAGADRSFAIAPHGIDNKP
jgi:hypothetical protein